MRPRTRGVLLFLGWYFVATGEVRQIRITGKVGKNGVVGIGLRLPGNTTNLALFPIANMSYAATATSPPDTL